MLFYNNKLINTPEAELITKFVEPEPLPEKKEASTTPDGKTTFPLKSIKNIQKNLRDHYRERGSSDYETLQYTISSKKPPLIKNDDYFKIKLNTEILPFWYLHTNKYLSESPKTKLENLREKLLTDIIKKLKDYNCIAHVKHEPADTYISNLYAENSADEEQIKALFINSTIFDSLKTFLIQENTLHYFHFPWKYMEIIEKDAQGNKIISEQKINTEKHDIKEIAGKYQIPPKDLYNIHKLSEKLLHEQKEKWFKLLFRKPNLVVWLENQPAEEKNILIKEYKHYKKTLKQKVFTQTMLSSLLENQNHEEEEKINSPRN